MVEARRIHLLPDLDQIAVGTLHQAVLHLDHVEARAQRRIDRAHLEPDDPAADDEHAPGLLAQFERAGRGDDARVVLQFGRLQEGQLDRLGTGCNDRAPECNRLALAIGHHDAQAVWVGELASTVHDRDLAHLRHRGKATGQLADDLFLVGAQRGQVDRRCGVGHAHRRKVLHLVHHRGHVQQSLGGDATDIEAHTTERRVALDEDHPQPEVGCAKGGRVPARPGAEHEQIAAEVGAG